MEPHYVRCPHVDRENEENLNFSVLRENLSYIFFLAPIYSVTTESFKIAVRVPEPNFKVRKGSIGANMS